MKIKVKPLSDRVLVKPIPPEKITTSGIHIPDTALEKSQKGLVVAMGRGTKEDPITVKEGDEVLYGKYAGQEIELEKEVYLMMRESEIFAILLPEVK